MILKIFQEKILDEINNSGLSIEAIYFIMKDIMNEISFNYNQYITENREKIDIAKKYGYTGTIEENKEEETTEEK